MKTCVVDGDRQILHVDRVAAPRKDCTKIVLVLSSNIRHTMVPFERGSTMVTKSGWSKLTRLLSFEMKQPYSGCPEQKLCKMTIYAIKSKLPLDTMS